MTPPVLDALFRLVDLASGVMFVLYRLGHASAGLVVSTATGAGLTLIARWRGWQLPEPPGWQPSTSGPGSAVRAKVSR